MTIKMNPAIQNKQTKQKLHNKYNKVSLNKNPYNYINAVQVWETLNFTLATVC